MHVDIKGIGPTRVTRNNNKDFQSLSQYRKIAVITIKQYGGKYTKDLLRNEEALANIMTEIMIGDWRYDPDRSKTSSQGTYRINCARWAIKNYKRREYKKSNTKIQHLSAEDKSHQCHLIPYWADPLQILEDQEQTALLHELLDCGLLTDNESAFIKKYYLERQTYDEIGRAHSLSHQRVEQVVKRGLEKLQNLARNA